MKPKVSICIPVYKQVECLHRALNSIRDQTFQDYEIIVTDDTPDDSIKNMMENFNFGNRLKYFKKP